MSSPIPHLRTPVDRFRNLPDFDFPSRFLEDLPGYEGLRMQFLDVQPAHAAKGTFLCLHGEPSWSFLYRRMIPHFVRAGYRVVAPDLFGFGRSDKPTEDATYTFSFHRNSLMRLIERLDLSNITLVVQDWGGLLGLTIPMDMPQRFSRLLVMNTTLARGKSPGPGFDAWKAYAKANPDLPVGTLMKRGTPHLTAAEVAAYDAPFPDITYKAGARRFPQLVMVEPHMEGVDVSLRAAQWWSQSWNGATFMAVGMKDPVLGPPVMAELRNIIRGCPAPLEIAEGGHFVQEWGEEIAIEALKAFGG
jgi:pimeloyl-ACP methyl ester carboxylesterase